MTTAEKAQERRKALDSAVRNLTSSIDCLTIAVDSLTTQLEWTVCQLAQSPGATSLRGFSNSPMEASQ